MTQTTQRATRTRDPFIDLTPVEPERLSHAERRRLELIAEDLRKSDGAIDADHEEFHDELPVEVPRGEVRLLLMDDYSAIANIQEFPGVDYYPSRAYVRARDGDLVAATFPEIPRYHEYQEQYLGFGRPSYVPIPRVPGELPYATFVALLASEDTLERIARRAAAENHEFWLHPYMGQRPAWEVAKRLRERCGKPVRVLAPLPTVSRRVNDKVWFHEVACSVLGADHVVYCRSGRSLKEIASQLRSVAEVSEQVCLRLSDSATGQATTLLRGAELVGETVRETEARVAAWLKSIDWDERRAQVSIERWEAALRWPDTGKKMSPSVQVWIPPTTVRLPIVEGVFDQHFSEANELEFEGSEPSRLPERLQSELRTDALRLARVFQILGYVGRCSFDTIVVGTDLEDARVKFVECNGRWGGTSTPMLLMNRLFGDYRTQPYADRVTSLPGLKGVRFDRFLEAFQDVLYDRRTGRGWLIVYNTGPLEPVGKIDALALGRTRDEAVRRLDEFERLVAERCTSGTR